MSRWARREQQKDMTKRIEAERLPDGRLRVTLDESAEAAMLTMATFACDVVAEPVDPIDAKLASIKGHLDRAAELAESPLIFPPPLRRERLATADEIATMVHEAHNGDGQLPWWRIPPSARWFQVEGVSGRPGNSSPTIHYKAANGDVIGTTVDAFTTFPVCTAAEMAEAEAAA